MIAEKDSLELKLDKLKRQNQRLNTDVTSMMHKRKAQKSVVKKLESALEKVGRQKGVPSQVSLPSTCIP